MKPPRPPRVETRRAKQLEAELLERARAWIPAWGMDDDERDFGRALLKIAAHLSSEVAERLDRAGEKIRLGLLDWLAVQGEAARPARLPVVFRLADSAREAKTAAASTRLQVVAAGASVILQTETEVLVLPRGLQALVGVDGAKDAFFVAPPGLSSLAPLEPLPAQWQLKSSASSGSTMLQLDPEQGLAAGMHVELGGEQYRIAQVKEDIVTLDRALARHHAEKSIVAKVTAFMPFDRGQHNRQEHALYIGHTELFNIAAKATIEITGAKRLAKAAWHYWGKENPADKMSWLELRVASVQVQGRADYITLTKPEGSMEMLELVPGSESRWIRARFETVEADQAPLRVDAFKIRINCGHGAPLSPGSNLALAPFAEGMANTTPLVLQKVFSPFGTEPRQFDAFYLGSQEAFSKRGARVELSFTMADPNFASLTSLRSGPHENSFLAGVAGDGQLHLFRFSPSGNSLTPLPDRLPLRPPAPAAAKAPEPPQNRSFALDPCPAYRVPVWPVGRDTHVAVAAQGAVWVWQEDDRAQELSGWMPLGIVGPTLDSTTKIEGLVYIADGSAGRLYALRGARLFVLDLSKVAAAWNDVVLKEDKKVVRLAKISPICRENGDLGNGTLADGLVGVSTEGELFGINLSVPSHDKCTQLLTGLVSCTVAPAAVCRQDASLVVFAVDTQESPHMVAVRCDCVTFENCSPDAKIGLGLQPVGGSLDINFNGGHLTVAVSLEDKSGSTVLGSWVPYAQAGLDALFKVQVPPAFGALAGGPTLMPGHVLVPTSTSQVIVAGFDLARRVEAVGALRAAVIIADARDHFKAGDGFAQPTNGGGGEPKYELRAAPLDGIEFRGNKLYEFEPDAIGRPLLVYRTDARKLEGTVEPAKPRLIKVDRAAPHLAKGDVLRITIDEQSQLYVVEKFNRSTRIAKLDRDLDVVNATHPMTLEYVTLHASPAIIRPMLRVNQSITATWPASVPDPVSLSFLRADKRNWQPATANRLTVGPAEFFVIEEHLQSLLKVDPASVKFTVDGAADEWNAQLGDTTINPELSWEYWNGKGWWGLDIGLDGTRALKKSGLVRFKVPSDMAPTDWAGKTNHWIRVRLIGGDYGRETVTVTTTKLSKNSSEQTVARSTKGIRAPLVAALGISYGLCKPIRPTSVLVRESGSMRDQSDANCTDGAQVEAFVPLATLLGRLSGPPSAGTAMAEPAPLLGRAIYLGFDAPLCGEKVSLLLLVEERFHEQFAPMSVEALVADRFVPVVASDATRALGESGVLSLTFPLEPTPRELFGQTLRWLRLTPVAGSPSELWEPKLLGAYLNGVWACAAETLTRELIGSSQGEPNLTLYLARPPVLRNTLELRVKEPLGEEERDELRAERADQVLTALENLPGNWVLWKPVIDPGDEAPGARVYAFDEATGEIRFGDGRHGRIPPVGRDSIMAFTYRRTEPPLPGSVVVPGNAIAPRTSLNLVSPIDGVEQVLAADQAAGGAPAQDVGMVLRFGVANLRHRERALTARDLEDLALELFPDIAQARCSRRDGFVQLAAVMRGANPKPSAAQRRALHQALVAAAPPMLGAPGGLRIVEPILRHLRVGVALGVASLDNAGAVSRDARRRIAALFNTATGGVDGNGWPLGENPTEADVAFALADVPELQGIVSVALREIAGDGSEQPWPDSLALRELAWLAQDGVHIEIKTSGVAS